MTEFVARHADCSGALELLARSLGPRGQWPGWVRRDVAPEQGRRDLAAPLTALGILALDGLVHPLVPELLERSREHLERTVRPDGFWRYYANVPVDSDDTAMCALALGRTHPVVAANTVPGLAATRRRDGLFPTWIEPGWEPVVDAVANAHIVGVLGNHEASGAACEWLIGLVRQQREVAASAYYRDPLDLHVALSRAAAYGELPTLRPAIQVAAKRALKRLHWDLDMHPYRRAQAMVVLAAAVDLGDEALSRSRTVDVLHASGRQLLDQRDARGAWASGCLFVAGNTEGEGFWEYQSWAVTTALCVRALAAASSVATQTDS